MCSRSKEFDGQGKTRADTAKGPGSNQSVEVCALQHLMYHVSPYIHGADCKILRPSFALAPLSSKEQRSCGSPRDCRTWHTRAHTRVRMHTHTLWCSSSSLIILPHSMHCKRGLPMWCHHHLICPIQQDVLLLLKAVVYIHNIIWYSRSKSANKWLERQTTI